MSASGPQADGADILTTRPAGSEDADAIAVIWHQGYRDGHLGDVPDDVFAFRRLEDFRSRVPALVAVTTVAVVAGEVVGFVMVESDELHQLYVAAAVRGSGVADALIAQGEAQIARRFDRAWLAVVAANARARRFYERAGWREVGAIDQPSYAGPGQTVMVAALRYEKALVD